MSDEEQKPLVRVDIPLGGSKKAAFLAFRRWAEKVVAEQGNTMDPGWYSTYPKEEEPPEAETPAETPKSSGESVVRSRPTAAEAQASVSRSIRAEPQAQAGSHGAGDWQRWQAGRGHGQRAW